MAPLDHGPWYELETLCGTPLAPLTAGGSPPASRCASNRDISLHKRTVSSTNAAAPPAETAKKTLRFQDLW
ncbi:MAG: hypothetical protein ACK4N4_11835 [Burkholderiales bacterium]